MSLAECIRQFVFRNYIEVTRRAGRSEVQVRAGDVHKEMGLTSRMPAVCAAIGSKAFGRQFGVVLVDRVGPPQGANVYFRFRINEQRRAVSHALNPVQDVFTVSRSPTDASQTSAGAICLVSCVSRKRPKAAPAQDLYTSEWFTKARSYVEKLDAPWFILSAEYGLVSPADILEPYERTLNAMPVHERKVWANEVWRRLEPKLHGKRRVVFFAGQRYREFLVERIREFGIEVEIPLEGMRIGEQLSWLAK